MTKSKNLREHLTIEQKNEIIYFHEVNQELSLQKICQIFGRKFGRAIGKTHKLRIYFRLRLRVCDPFTDTFCSKGLKILFKI